MEAGLWPALLISLPPACLVKTSSCHVPACHLWKDSLTSHPGGWHVLMLPAAPPTLQLVRSLHVPVQLPSHLFSGNQWFLTSTSLPVLLLLPDLRLI